MRIQAKMAVSAVKKYQIALFVVLIAAAAIIASCASSSHDTTDEAPLQQEQSNVAGQELTQVYEKPDPSPPRASLNGKPLMMASAIWRVDGKVKSLRAPDETDIPINTGFDASSEWKFNVSSAHYPITVDIRSFLSLNSAGIPANDVPDEEFSCVPAGENCEYRIADGLLSVILPFGKIKQGGVYVLEVTYPTQEDEDIRENINHYAVSWAVRT